MVDDCSYKLTFGGQHSVFASATIVAQKVVNGHTGKCLGNYQTYFGILRFCANLCD